MTSIPDRLSAALADRYLIERELGQGGMATVFLAEDLKHKRKVALKVLKPELAAVLGAERFVQEITTTASLQHPHILPLFDSGTADGFLYYVMPFIEGETLRDKLNRETQLAIDDAVRIATEVADALGYAHGKGVIHRDIKPENILLANGRPMVADFGIALAVSAAAGGRMTETGLSLGTPHYMSPEQATAEKEITARSDVYSLASVLYEMLTGNPPHVGSSAQQVIMRIIADRPRPVTEARSTVPSNVAAAVAKGLEKLPADRFATAQDFARALNDVSFTRPGTSAVTAPGAAASAGVWARRIPWAIAAAATAALIAVLAWPRSSPSDRVTRLRIVTENHWSAVTMLPYTSALAPDGSGLAWVDSTDDGTVLRFRQRDATVGTVLPGTEGAMAPAFSPDGQSIVFVARGVLKKVARAGGPTSTVTTGVNFGAPSAAWSDDGFIYFVDENFGVRRVPSAGGESEVVVTPGQIAGLGALELWALPGGRGLLFTGCDQNCENTSIFAWDARADSVVHLADNARGTWYMPDGYLLYTSGTGGALAAPFDLGQLAFTGPAIPVLDDVSPGDVVMGKDGTLMYSVVPSSSQAPNVQESELVWVTRDGKTTAFDSTWRDAFSDPAISPDGRSVAVAISEGGSNSIWVRPLDGGAPRRVTFEGAASRAAWNPDGRSIAHMLMSTQSALFEVPVDGRGRPRSLVASSDTTERLWEVAYSPVGDWLIYRKNAAPSSSLHALNLRTDSTITLVEAGAMVVAPTVSPDGRWIAFQSDRSGQAEVYVRPFPDAAGAEWKVSNGGGISPRWSRNGKEIFYISRDRMMWSAEVEGGGQFTVGNRRSLFTLDELTADGGLHTPYDVSPDGQRFLMVRAAIVGQARDVIWVENWFTELRAKMKR